jgi:hypothetical protein
MIALSIKGHQPAGGLRPVIRSGASRLWYRHPTVLWVTASFVVAAALTAIVFGLVDAQDGVGVALRVTARWSFLLFWFAYAGGAMATLWVSRSTVWPVTAVNFASPLRPRNWCMLD